MLLPLGFLLICGIAAASIANNKGYSSIIWFFAAGPAGLSALRLLPDSNLHNLSNEEAARLRRKGNMIGLGLGVFAVALIAVTWALINRYLR